MVNKYGEVGHGEINERVCCSRETKRSVNLVRLGQVRMIETMSSFWNEIHGQRKYSIILR